MHVRAWQSMDLTIDGNELFLLSIWILDLLYGFLLV